MTSDFSGPETENNRLVVELEQLRRENAELKHHVKESREWFFETFKVSPGLIAITRIEDGKIYFINQVSADLHGIDRKKLIGSTAKEMGLWADPAQRDSVIRKIREEGGVCNYEVDFVGKNQEIRHVLFSANPVTFNGESCMLSVALDITDRKKIVTALRESEERFLLITNAIDEIFYIYDAEKKVATYISPAFERIWGYSVKKVLNNKEPFIEPVHPDDRKKVLDWGPRLAAGEPVDYEYRIIRADGSLRYISDHGFPVAEKDGKVTLYVGTGRDITKRRRAEEALKESREYLNQIINCIGDSIFVKDRNHKIVLVNDAYCRFTGKRREEIIGTNGLEGVSEDIARSIMEDDERVFESGKEGKEEGAIADADGRERYIMTKKTLLTDKNGNKQLILVSRDISEYKKLEVQFLQAQKMEAIGILAGGVAHDFNNLLNVINGYSELLLRDLHSDSPIRTDLEHIRYAGERAAALTSQLLAFGRKQILKPEVVDLNIIITQMASMLQRLIGEDIHFTARTTPKLGLVHADPAKIQQVIMNLAVNARDAMPQGGGLVAKTANVDFSADDGKTSSMMKPGSYVMLAISDTGIGMDEETKAHIFEPFFTTKEKGKGTGLGLATVYGIIKQSNGFIWVYSEPGKGTTFKIYFPRVEAGNAYDELKDEKVTGEKGTETILLVEDEEGVRSLTSRILRDQGYFVMEAGEGFEALRLAEAHSGEIHMVIADVVMPGMSGSTLVSKLETARPGIKTLYISGYTDDMIIRHGIQGSNIAFLEKPFSIYQLTAKVREVLNS